MGNIIRKKIITGLGFLKKEYILGNYKKKISLALVLILLLQGLTQPNYYACADPLDDTQVPTAPTDLTVAAVSGSAISLSWNASADDIGVKEYQVYSNDNNIGSTIDTNYTFNGIEGNTYSFHVIAYDEAGNASAQSNAVSASIPGAADTLAPSAPTNLTISSVSGSAIALTWNAAIDNIGVKDYEIYVNNTSIGNTNETSYTYIGLSEEITYEFYVIAYDEAGNSSIPSNTVVKPADIQMPGAPLNLIIESVTGSAITLKWDPNPNNIEISKYGIYNSGTLIGETVKSSFTYTHLNEGSTYNFYVVTYDMEQNTSPPSNSVAITIEMQAPTAPQNLKIESVSGSAITLIWDSGIDNIGINKYEIYSNNILIGETAATSFTYTQLIAGNIYNFYLIAYDIVMNASAPSDIVTIPYEIQAPSAPANLVIEAVSGSAITLRWEASTSSIGISKYEIYCNNNIIGETTGTSYSFNKSDDEDTYSFYVVAYDIIDNASAPSNTVIKIFDSLAPESPKNLRIIAVSGMKVTLEWDASTDIGGIKEYAVYCNNNLAGTTTETNYVCKDLTEGFTYKFYVVAYDNANNVSAHSNVVYEAIGYSINLEATNVTDTAVDLAWTFSNIVTGDVIYKIFRDGVEIGTTSDTHYSDNGLTQGMEYTYSIKAFDENNELVGTSALLIINTIDTQAPTAPENLILLSLRGNIATLSWDASVDNVGIEGYYIYQYFYGSYNLMGTTTGNSVSIELYPNKAAPIYVRAFDKAGNISQLSQPLNITTGYEIPHFLQIKETDAGIEISWDLKFYGADWFDLSINGEIIRLQHTYSYLQTDIIPNQIYEYKIRAGGQWYELGDCSEWSDSIFAYFGRVTDLTVNELDGSLAELIWDPVTGASSYEIEINGVIVDSVTNTSYSYNNISSISNTYKVRPVIGDLRGTWTIYTIWNSSGSPYILYDNLYVSKYMTLVIKPGVTVKFADRMEGLIVYGNLIAEGSAQEPIIFTSIEDPNPEIYDGEPDRSIKWNGIAVVGTGELLGNYLVIKYAEEYYVNIPDFFYNQSAIYIQGMGKVFLDNSIIYSPNYTGVFISSGNDVTIQNTTFNHIGMNGIYIYKQFSNSGTVTIKNNTIQGANNYGIYVDESGNDGLIAENNTIKGISKGIYIYRHGMGVFKIIGNNFATNDIGWLDYNIKISLYYMYLPSILENVINNTFDRSFNSNIPLYKRFIQLEGINAFDMDLTLTANEYYINGTFIIPFGKTVYIQQGAALYFDSYASFLVDGKLSIQGTEDNPVLMTSCDDPDIYGYGEDSWQGIRDYGELEANYLQIKYGRENITVYGKLSIYNSKIMNAYSGISFSYFEDPPVLMYNSFIDNEYAINNDYGFYNIVNAEHNYWNSIYGPSIQIKTYNPDTGWSTQWIGDGEKINFNYADNVDYIPFLGMESSIEVHFNQTNGTYAPTGNYSYQNTDMKVNCLEDTIEFNRSYNSQNVNFYGVFGSGWSFNYESHITESDYYDYVMQVILPDGSRDAFQLNKNGSYTSLYSRNRLVRYPDGTYILSTKDQIKYRFNIQGMLTEIENKEGNKIFINLNSHGKPQRLTDYAGRQYYFTYENNLLKTITDPLGRTIEYIYNNSKLIRVINPDGIITNYIYNPGGYLSEVRDAHNNLIEAVTYKAEDALTKVDYLTDAFGNVKTYSYDELSGKTTITDSNGRSTTQWYDNTFNIINIMDTDGRIRSITYFKDEDVNKYNEIQSESDRNGNITQYERDDRGNVTKVINPDGGYRQYTYDEHNNVTSERDESGKYTYYIYDLTQTYLLKTVQPLNGTDVYSEVSDQSKFAITANTYYQYGENGYLINGLLKSITYPNENVVAYTYDHNGNVSTVKNNEGDVTTNYYDNIGRLTSTLSPKGELTQYTYNNNGDLTLVMLSGGETTETVYNELGQRIQVITPNLYQLPSKEGIGYRYTYYPSGEIRTVTDPENNTTIYAYDLYGNISSETKPNGCIYIYNYDFLNRVTAIFVQNSAADHMELIRSYSYSILADKTTQKAETLYLNASETAVTAYVYDYAGRLLSQTNPDGGIIGNIYNANGTVSIQTDAMNKPTFFRYDGLNRLTEQWRAFENNMFSYKNVIYDLNGNVIEERTGIDLVALFEIPTDFITTSYTYDTNNRMIRKTDSANSRTDYEYDANGNRIKEKAYLNENDMKVTEYIYNHLGKAAEMTQHVDAMDLYGYAISNPADILLKTIYTYDANGNVITITTPDNVVTVFEYDNLDRLISESVNGLDEYGNNSDITNTYTYDYAGNILTSTNANGNITQNNYNPKGLLEKTIDPEGGITAYYYDNAGRMVSKVLPKNYVEGLSLAQMSRIVFVYDNMNRVILEQDIYYDILSEAFKTIDAKAYKYDYNGNVIKALDALGYADGTGTTITEKINAGYGTGYSYNDAGLLLTTLSPVTQDNGLSFDVHYSYDGAGRMISETNANNVITKYSYDDAGRLIKTTLTDTTEKILHQATYDWLGNILTQTDGNGNTTAYSYNKLGLLRRTTTPNDSTIAANIIRNQYDVKGQLVYQTDSMGKDLIYTYNHNGQVLSQTERKEDGTHSITISNAYDKNGNLRFETDANGVTTEYVYDALNRVLSVSTSVDNVNHITTNTYDRNGNILTTTDWLGNVYTNEYDALNRLSKKTDPYGKVIEKYEYNDNHVQIAAYDALNNFTSYTYDKNNRLLTTTDPEGHTMSQSYDVVGNIASRTDGMNNATTFHYDALNRLTEVTNAKNEITGYTYDLAGNILTQTDGGGNTVTYSYNTANLPIRKADPNAGTDAGKIERYTYYADGTLRTKQDRNGNITTYIYDIHGNLSSETTGSAVKAYTYDNNGNMLTMTDSTGTTSRTYDELRRVLTKDVPYVGTITYVYDITDGADAGEYKERSTDPKGNIVEKAYDKTGRLSKVINGSDETAYSYYDNGNTESVTYSNDFKEVYTYYADNQLESLVNLDAVGNIMDSYSYTYDNAGNQLTKYELINGTAKGTTTYTYDALNRLLTVTEPSGNTTAYDYDGAGNRIQETAVSGSIITVNTYSYNDQNRLTAVTTRVNNEITKVTDYTYDNNGNQLITEVKTYVDGALSSTETVQDNTYNEYNQLIQTISEDGTVISNTYNAEGYRVKKEADGEKTCYLYEADKVILELDETGSQTARNVYGINLLTRTEDGETYYYMYNGHADVTALVSDTGSIAASYYYDAFGNILESTGDVNNSILYSGYQYDEETGLYYLNARMYDPKTARFLQQDTYSGDRNDPLSLNLYTYCANNPIVYQDPSGHVFIFPIPGGEDIAPVIPPFPAVKQKDKGIIGAITDGLKSLDEFNKKVTEVVIKAIVVTTVSTIAAINKSINQDEKDKNSGSIEVEDKTGNYAPDRKLPRTKNGDPIPDTDVPHTQLGQRDDGKGAYNQGRTWVDNPSGNGVTAKKDIDFSDHGKPDEHPNPHEHELTPNNPATAPKGGYKRGGPQPLLK